jgi:hypothetical protein
MNKRLLAGLLFATALLIFRATHGIAGASTRPGTGDGPQFTADGKLLRPAGYRRWIFVSSGFGMSYTQKSANDKPLFTNVFVQPSAYDSYLATGRWPEKTVFVLELYSSESQGSINKTGSYQARFAGLDVEVKDATRFADKWAYFNFEGTQTVAAAIAPGQNACWNCHEQNAAVEHSFVQFYPELLKVARARNTLKKNVSLEK